MRYRERRFGDDPQRGRARTLHGFGGWDMEPEAYLGVSLSMWEGKKLVVRLFQ